MKRALSDVGEPVLVLGGTAACSVVLGYGLLQPSIARVVIAAAIVGLGIGICWVSPRSVVVPLLVWLAAVGLIRKLAADFGGETPVGDPLLLVEPIMIGLLVLAAAQRGAFSNRTQLANAVLFLQVILAASVLNPLQGGPLVGVGGLLTIVIPTALFWVGRVYGDDRIVWRLGTAAVILGVAVAVYGLFQTYRGFPSWDERWNEDRAFAALNLGGGVIRSVSSFVSASEFAVFLSIGLVIAIARLRFNAASIPLIVGAGIMGTALWLVGGRGTVVSAVVAVAVVLAARLGWPAVRMVVVAGLCLVAIPLVVSQFSTATEGSDVASTAHNRQITGLGDPFGENSTLPGHLRSMSGGITSAVRNPAGVGVGSISVSAGRYGGAEGGTESDVSNAAVAAGVLGFLAYLLVACRGLSIAWSEARTRAPVEVMQLGILAVTALQWLTGGNYIAAFLVWFVLGSVDRRTLHTANDLEKSVPVSRGG